MLTILSLIKAASKLLIAGIFQSAGADITDAFQHSFNEISSGQQVILVQNTHSSETL